MNAESSSYTRRDFLQKTTLALGATALAAPLLTHGGQFTGKIRKSLKWGMVKEAKNLSVKEAFQKLKACGYDGVEPSLNQVPDDAVDEWIAASKATGLIIDGTVGARTENLEPGIDLTKKLGGDSILVVARYDQKKSIQPQWDKARDQLKEASVHAGKQGIKLLVENVWATFLISPFDMVRFIDEIGSPWVQVHFDIGNMVRWGVAEHWAEVLGKRSQKLDVKEYDLKKAMNEGMGKGFNVPLGEGSINWPAVRVELAKINYTGWAAAEVAGGDWDYLTDVAKRMDKVLDICV